MGFKQAVMTGLAPDGGLLIPETIPSVSTQKLKAWESKSFIELAKEILSLYIDDIPPVQLKQLVDEAYAAFDIPEVIAMTSVEELQVLELFHGPTLAFKDIALQFLGRLFQHILEVEKGHLNILAATSGDTGSAAIAGVSGLSNIDIFVMYPKGKISNLQELQMTAAPAENVHCLAVQGSFDDCQNIMKSLFGDIGFKERYHLGAVNSVNWARILAQIVYYAFASLKFNGSNPPSFVIPTGNFGNIFAGIIAKKMGFPIDKLILATNENDILARFFNSGRYSRGQVHYTLSPAMDIQVASNFERFLYYAMGSDSERLCRFMENFAKEGTATMDSYETGTILATSITNNETRTAMRAVYKNNGYVADPHTAVGLSAAGRFSVIGQKICLSTAHPAKFPETVDSVLGENLVSHERLNKLKGLESRSITVNADQDLIAKYIVDNCRA
tara:strand:+ start:4539 stop:5870 length:1332 start_codon:yes stop_codon:yes gene_type:complete